MFAALLVISLQSWSTTTLAENMALPEVFPPDSNKSDTGKVDLRYPFQDNTLTPFSNNPYTPFSLQNPSNIQSRFEYDPKTGNYYYKETLGEGTRFRPDSYMTFDEFQDYKFRKSIEDYWGEKVATESEYNKEDKWSIPPINVESKFFDNVFGGNTIDIRPSGSAELIFGVNTSRTDNPAIPERQRRISTFDFDQRIQLNMIGNIGDKLKLTTNYNTEATFDFENQMKLEYTGYEDEIIQKIEAGNVTLPLQGSLIQGSQSLFGVKTKLQFGRLSVTSVFSQQRGERSNIQVQGGAQTKEFELKADNYDFNRHFFLAHYFRNNYENAVGSPPLLNSGVNITKIEVWVTNTNFSTQNVRNVVAFQDLGESARRYNNNINVLGGGPLPFNDVNDLYQEVANNSEVRGFLQASNYLDSRNYNPRLDYHRIESARKLSENEYSFNNQLGYISLNQELQPNQVLAVAFQYTFRGQTYQVGEFSTDGVNGSNALILKMLKSTELNTKVPMWDLMMKNVYSLGAYGVERTNFILNIWYLDRSLGVETNFISEGAIKGVPLIQVTGLDKLDVNGNPQSDGLFDYLDNPRITINPQNGRVYFPVLEPFGRTLRESFNDPQLAEQYAFDSLYTNTQIDAQNKFPNKNRFTIKGEYQSSSSNEISLNALNVPEGSVKVTAGGRQLQENIDYTVDYTLGRVKIINTGLLESGTPINISLESNSLFNIQTKTLLATRFDYEVNDDLQFGATVMNLTERPLTQKVNVGDEPMSNTVYGFDGNYRTESDFLTKMVDKIPFIDTKEKSTVEVSGEFAQLIPGVSRAVGSRGTAYIDDFEGSQSEIDMSAFIAWSIASTPQGQPNLFPEGELRNNLASGYNRAKLAWYKIDPLFYRNNNLTPDHIRNNPAMQSNHFMREIFQSEVFPNKQLANGQLANIPVFDLAYYPSRRGPYNYDLGQPDSTGIVYGAGLNPDGTLQDPESRWGGIMRRIDQYDFEAANIEFIQFWMMDPFNEDYEYQNDPDQGKLYFNLGNISEDVQRDGLKIIENGLPTDPAQVQDLTGQDFSNWGRVTLGQQIVNGFDNNPDLRQYQDVGLDGLRNQEERVFFEDYVAQASAIAPAAADEIANDPSADDFTYYRTGFWDNQQANVLERYQFFNGLEGNSPTSVNAGGSQRPNAEDINGDNTLDEIESYWQYELEISPQAINPANVGNNYITDVFETSVNTKDGRNRPIRWYQFRIPIRENPENINGITDFRSIRFMRMFLRNFEHPVNLRFASMELVRGEWRRYLGDLDADGDYILEEDESTFAVAAVNIEENGNKTPVNYVLPPDIEREINVGTTNLQQLNEQSLSLRVCDLADGKAKAAYRNMDLDVRSYKKIRLYVHGEALDPNQSLTDEDLTAFVRLGTDFEDNYYEYEIPLKITPEGRYNGDTDAGRRQVWPDANNIVIDFSQLQRAKTSRNRASLESGSSVTNQTRYQFSDGNATIYIVGNPNLSTVKTIMLGVRNKKKTLGNVSDDGLPKCAEVWFNEMRLTDFDNISGWAALARVQSQLADFATVSVSASMSTPGWGSIEDKVSERQRETVQQFDASANINMGKFFGDDSGIKIPMYVGYSEGVVKPQFAPLEPDILFDDYIDETFIDKDRQDSVRRVQETRTIRRSINFTNVRKEKTNPQKKARFYDVSNFSLTYSYSDQFSRDFNTEFDLTRNHRGGLSYSFNNQPKNYRPLSKVKFLRKSKYLAILRDFNFYVSPKQIGFRTEFNRNYQESRRRNNQPNVEVSIPTFVNKSFNWNRAYDVRYDLTRALKVDFQANNQALITEPAGRVTRDDEDSYETWRDSVWSQIADLGTTMNYSHTTNVNYNLPLNKIPATDWISSSVRYGSGYSWQRALFAADSLGNTIQNNAQWQANASFNMNTLYNKVGFLREINRKSRLNARGGNRGFNPRSGQNQTASDSTKTKNKDGLNFFEHSAKVLMMLKNVNVTYSNNQGTMVPGYNQRTTVLGMNPSFNAPGVGFIFGQQGSFGENNEDFIRYAASKDWLVKQNNLNTAYSRTYSEQWNFRASIEPARDLKIDLSATRQMNRNFQEFFRWNDTLFFDNGTFDPNGGFVSESPQTVGSFSVSYNIWRTAFETQGEDNISDAFETFSEYRTIISNRLGEENSEFSSGGHATDVGYADGYGAGQQEVLIPAFLAAYSGKSPDRIGLSPFINIPDPNWRITYTGLTKVDFIKKYFKTFTINHSYRSNFNVSSFRTNVLYENDGDGFTSQRDPVTGNNFVPEYEIQTVTLSEQFSPLINLDMTWNNSLITRFEVRRDRNLSLSFANSQVTESRSNELIVGLGYTFEKVPLPFQRPSQRNKIQSDLRLRGDISIRDNVTIIRKLNDDIKPNEPTGGQRIVSLKFTADYTLSNRLNLRLFFDRMVTEPKISLSFPTANTNAGVSIRFTISS